MVDLLPGTLGYIFLISILDAAVLSWLVLLWYRRTVRALMGRGQVSRPAEMPVAGITGSDTGDPAGLKFETVDPAASGNGESSLPHLKSRRKRLVAAYALGAAVHAAVICWLQVGAGGDGARLIVVFAYWWANLWPLVPVVVAILVLDRRSSVALTIGFLALGAVIGSALTLGVQVARHAFNTAPLTNAYGILLAVVTTAVPPGLVLLITAQRRIRAVMPLALASTLLFGLALFLWHDALDIAVSDQRSREILLSISTWVSFRVATYALFMLAALPIGYVAWSVLQRLARAFEHKRFSDLQLVIDCWWVIVTADQVASSLAELYGIRAVVGGLAAFAGYRVTVALVLGIWRTAGQPSSPRLLLLRVFGYQRRTESLFDRVAGLWRFRGPVQLIAGVDLAMRTVDPAEILAFIRGRLGERYVRTIDAVPARLLAMDRHPDPDGRFRVDEVYCHADTWQSTLEALLDVSEIVLMDLRSFSARNAGCVFELHQVMRQVATERIVMVYDRTTDLPLLEGVLREGWRAAHEAGRARGDGSISLVRIEQNSRLEIAALMRRLTADTPASSIAPVL